MMKALEYVDRQASVALTFSEFRVVGTAVKVSAFGHPPSG